MIATFCYKMVQRMPQKYLSVLVLLVLVLVGSVDAQQRRPCSDTRAIQRSCPRPQTGKQIPSVCDTDACAHAFEGWWDHCAASVPRGRLRSSLATFHSKCLDQLIPPAGSTPVWPKAYMLSGASLRSGGDSGRTPPALGKYTRTSTTCRGAPVYEHSKGYYDNPTFLYRNTHSSHGLFWMVGYTSNNKASDVCNPKLSANTGDNTGAILDTATGASSKNCGAAGPDAVGCARAWRECHEGAFACFAFPGDNSHNSWFHQRTRSLRAVALSGAAGGQAPPPPPNPWGQPPPPPPPSNGGGGQTKGWPVTYVLAMTKSKLRGTKDDHNKMSGTYRIVPGKMCNGAPVWKGQGSIDETYLYRHKCEAGVCDGMYWAIGEGSAAEWMSPLDCRINGIGFETTQAPTSCGAAGPDSSACAGKWQECNLSLCKVGRGKEFLSSGSIKVTAGTGH